MRLANRAQAGLGGLSLIDAYGTSALRSWLPLSALEEEGAGYLAALLRLLSADGMYVFLLPSCLRQASSESHSHSNQGPLCAGGDQQRGDSPSAQAAAQRRHFAGTAGARQASGRADDRLASSRRPLLEPSPQPPPGAPPLAQVRSQKLCVWAEALALSPFFLVPLQRCHRGRCSRTPSGP